MPFEVDLFPWVKTRAAITAVLGGAAAPRWFYNAAPQGAVRPYAVYSLGGFESTHHQGGKSAIEQPRLVVDVFGTEDAAAQRAVVRAIDGDLDGFRGLMGTTYVRRITREGLQDLPELRADGSERQTTRTRCEYSVWVV